MKINEKLLKNTKYGKFIESFHKTLWTGTWQSGTITVEGVSDYQSIIVYVTSDVDNKDPIVCHKRSNGNFVGGFPAGGVNNTSSWTKSVELEVDGDNLTFVYCTELKHNSSGQHTGGKSDEIFKIVGFIPDLEKMDELV